MDEWLSAYDIGAWKAPFLSYIKVKIVWHKSFIVVMIDEKSDQGILAELEDPKIFVICYKQ